MVTPKVGSEVLQQAIKIIQRNPGITRDRLAVAMGTTAYEESASGRRLRSDAKALHRALLRSGLVEERESIRSELPELYPVGYVSPVNRRLFQPAYVPPLKVWVDPAVIDRDVQPVRSPIVDVIPNSKRKMRLTTDQKLKAFKDLCDQQITAASRPSLAQLSRDAAGHANWAQSHPEAKAYYWAKVNAFDAEKDELPAEQSQLLEENRRLKEQVKSLLTQQQAALELVEQHQDDRDLIRTWLERQRSLWISKIQEIESDLTAAADNLDAVNRMLEIYELEGAMLPALPPVPPVEHNGHRHGTNAENYGAHSPV